MRTQREHGRPHKTGEASGGPALPAPASQGLASAQGTGSICGVCYDSLSRLMRPLSSHRDLRNGRGGPGGLAGPRTQGGICLGREEGTAFLEEG